MHVEVSEGFRKTIADIVDCCVEGNTNSCTLEVEVRENVSLVIDMKFEVKGHSYPYDFPYDYGTHFIWTSLDEVDIWDSKENQRANYKNNFEGKNVFITMSEIMSEIEKYYEIL